MSTVRVSGYDPQDDMLKVKSIQKKVRDSFTSPLAERWDVTATGGSSASISGGVLTVASGTTAGDFVELLSRDTFTIPFRAMAVVQTGTRQANNHQMIELVSVDPNTGAIDERHSMDIDIGGAATTTATQMVYGVQNGGLRSLLSTPASSVITTTASYSILEMEPFSDEAYFHSRAVDATTGRSNSYVRHQQIPDPNGTYKLRIRSMNHGAWLNVTGAVAGTGGVIRLTVTAHGATTGNTVWVEQLNGVTDNGGRVRGNYTVTVVDANTIELQGTTFSGAYFAGSGRIARALAPAANASLLFQCTNLQDYAELTAEITAGRGQIVEGQAVGVRTVNGSTVTATLAAGTALAGSVFNADNVYWNESVTAQAASATVTGLSRSTGIVAGSNHRYAAFNAFAFADQAGTVRIEISTDGTTWRRASADVAVAANTPVHLSVPVTAQFYRAVYVNGATLQTQFMLNTSYTVA